MLNQYLLIARRHSFHGIFRVCPIGLVLFQRFDLLLQHVDIGRLLLFFGLHPLELGFTLGSLRLYECLRVVRLENAILLINKLRRQHIQ